MSFLSAGWSFVIAGSLFIGLGGFLTTKGWNEFSNYYSRQALITAAVREAQQNDAYLSDLDSAMSKLADLEKVYLLPRFQFHAIRQIPTSHLFGRPEEGIRKAAASFVYNIGPANDSILKLNFIFSGTTPPLEKQKEIFQNFHSSALLDRLRHSHQELTDSLQTVR